MNKLTDLMRINIAQAGYTEVLTFALVCFYDMLCLFLDGGIVILL